MRTKQKEIVLLLYLSSIELPIDNRLWGVETNIAHCEGHSFRVHPLQTTQVRLQFDANCILFYTCKHLLLEIPSLSIKALLFIECCVSNVQHEEHSIQ